MMLVSPFEPLPLSPPLPDPPFRPFTPTLYTITESASVSKPTGWLKERDGSALVEDATALLFEESRLGLDSAAKTKSFKSLRGVTEKMPCVSSDWPLE